MTLKERVSVKKPVSAGVLCLLAACSGSGSGDGDGPVDNPVANIGSTSAAGLIPSVATGAVLTVGQVEDWDDAISPIAASLFATEPVTPWSDVPDAGSADYEYVGGIELVRVPGNTDRVFGTMNANTDFGSGEITGEATNFYSDAGDPQPGELEFDANFFRGNDLTTLNGISGSLSGILTGDVIDGLVDVNIAGDFADSATVIYGGGIGTAAGEDVQATFVLSRD